MAGVASARRELRRDQSNISTVSSLSARSTNVPGVKQTLSSGGGNRKHTKFEGLHPTITARVRREIEPPALKAVQVDAHLDYHEQLILKVGQTISHTKKHLHDTELALNLEPPDTAPAEHIQWEQKVKELLGTSLETTFPNFLNIKREHDTKRLILQRTKQMENAVSQEEWQEKVNRNITRQTASLQKKILSGKANFGTDDKGEVLRVIPNYAGCNTIYSDTRELVSRESWNIPRESSETSLPPWFHPQYYNLENHLRSVSPEKHDNFYSIAFKAPARHHVSEEVVNRQKISRRRERIREIKTVSRESRRSKRLQQSRGEEQTASTFSPIQQQQQQQQGISRTSSHASFHLGSSDEEEEEEGSVGESQDHHNNNKDNNNDNDDDDNWSLDDIYGEDLVIEGSKHIRPKYKIQPDPAAVDQTIIEQETAAAITTTSTSVVSPSHKKNLKLSHKLSLKTYQSSLGDPTIPHSSSSSNTPLLNKPPLPALSPILTKNNTRSNTIISHHNNNNNNNNIDDLDHSVTTQTLPSSSSTSQDTLSPTTKSPKRYSQLLKLSQPSSSSSPSQKKRLSRSQISKKTNQPLSASIPRQLRLGSTITVNPHITTSNTSNTSLQPSSSSIYDDEWKRPVTFYQKMVFHATNCSSNNSTTGSSQSSSIFSGSAQDFAALAEHDIRRIERVRRRRLEKAQQQSNTILNPIHSIQSYPLKILDGEARLMDLHKAPDYTYKALVNQKPLLFHIPEYTTSHPSHGTTSATSAISHNTNSEFISSPSPRSNSYLTSSGNATTTSTSSITGGVHGGGGSSSTLLDGGNSQHLLNASSNASITTTNLDQPREQQSITIETILHPNSPPPTIYHPPEDSSSSSSRPPSSINKHSSSTYRNTSTSSFSSAENRRSTRRLVRTPTTTTASYDLFAIKDVPYRSADQLIRERRLRSARIKPTTTNTPTTAANNTTSFSTSITTPHHHLESYSPIGSPPESRGGGGGRDPIHTTNTTSSSSSQRKFSSPSSRIAYQLATSQYPRVPSKMMLGGQVTSSANDSPLAREGMSYQLPDQTRPISASIDDWCEEHQVVRVNVLASMKRKDPFLQEHQQLPSIALSVHGLLLEENPYTAEHELIKKNEGKELDEIVVS